MSPGSQGETYVDGGITRLPKGKKRKMLFFTTPHAQHGLNIRSPRYGFSEDSSNDSIRDGPRAYINMPTYTAIEDAFKRTCTRNQTMFQAYDTDFFPSADTIDKLIAHAVEYFLPSLPFIRKSLLLTQQRTWILYLALAAVGTRYVSNVSVQEVESANEFLRRALLLVSGMSSRIIDGLDLAQTKVLACICSMYSSEHGQESIGRALLGELAEFCISGWRLASHPHPSHTPKDIWILKESCIRTANAIWFLDRLMAYQLSSRPLLTIDDCTAPLPSGDSFWLETNLDADSDSDSESSIWTTETLPENIACLRRATEMLYMEKRIDPRIAEFAKILLIHALICQTHEVSERCRSRLSAWEPCAKTYAQEGLPGLGAPPWLPGTPLYARWRNAACDCLDVLHWQANAAIGQAAGREHPTVFFLHLARVVILCPVDRLRHMVYMLTSRVPPIRTEVESISFELTKWAHEDCYKARLAVIHAGVLLYHVRRHSLNSFYEPAAIFLAILCLWAYGSAHSGVTETPMSGPSASVDGMGDTEEEFVPDLIHVDRPCDDEIVQLFITKGNRITPNMTGVGDICAPGGPASVLKVGCSVLRYARNWDLGNYYAGILNDLHTRISRPAR